MQENHTFEYAIIRVVPKVEREEFLNVGVILYCRQHQFLGVVFTLDEKRLLSLAPYADIEEIRSHLNALEEISSGKKDCSPVAEWEIANRFRWLTAKRSTIVQCSDVHPGLCVNPAETLHKLHSQLVLINNS